MRIVICSCLLLFTAVSAVRADTALTALRLLPREKGAQLARIEAREGTPDADRWYFVVRDEADEKGVHEYVVAGGEIVASRSISQFAETVQAGDVIGADAIKVDSDRVARLAQDYAQANNLTISKINYELRKDGEDAAPVWRATCLDESGKTVAELTLTAGKGTIVSHEGFAVSPASPQNTPKFEVNAGLVTTSGSDELASTDTTGSGNAGAQPQKGRSADGRSHGIGGAFRHVGGTLQKLFTGHNTIDRQN